MDIQNAKQYFTITEIERRWNCSTADIGHFAETGKLEICVYQSGVRKVPWEIGDKTKDRIEGGRSVGDPIKGYVLFSVCKHFAAEVFRVGRAYLKYGKPQFYGERCEQIYIPTGGRRSLSGGKGQPITIHDLYITHKEIERFEKENPLSPDEPVTLERLQSENNCLKKEIEKLNSKGTSEKQKDEIEVKLLGKILLKENPESSATDLKNHEWIQPYVKKYPNKKDIVGNWLKDIGAGPGRRGIKSKSVKTPKAYNVHTVHVDGHRY